MFTSRLIRMRKLRAYFAGQPLEFRPCPICRSEETRHLTIGDKNFIGIHTSQCVRCGFIFSSPYYPPAVIEEFYRSSVYRALFKGQLNPKKFITRQTRLRDRARYFLELFKDEETIPAEGGRVLDVGCGEGTLLRALRVLRPDLRLVGVEPEVAYERSIFEETEIPIKSTIFELKAGDSFELVTCIHVLEHVSNPVRLLEEIQERLSPAGWCFVDVPNVAFYNRLDNLNLAHCNHFSTYTLILALRRAGFAVRKIVAHNPVTLLPSIYALAQRGECQDREVEFDPEGHLNVDRVRQLQSSKIGYLLRRLRRKVGRRIVAVKRRLLRETVAASP